MMKFLTALFALYFVVQTSWAGAIYCADSAMSKTEEILASVDMSMMDCHPATTTAKKQPSSSQCPFQKLSDCYDLDDLSNVDSKKLKDFPQKDAATFIEPILVQQPKGDYSAHSRAPPIIEYKQTSLILTTSRFRQ